MKNKQKAVLKILYLILNLCVVFNLRAQPVNSIVEKADSLFTSKQYTQSLELYKQVLNQKTYSASILLKMAYIQEGLGQISESLYYLNLYYLASNDKSALKKMEEVASTHRLQGYQVNQSRQVYYFLRSNYDVMTKILLGLCVLLFGLLIFQKRRQKKPMTIAIMLLLLLSVFFFHINFSQKANMGIVHNNGTYLMSGPSAGSSVVGIIDEGHLLDLLGKDDVWIHVKWRNQDAYIKEDKILEIEL